MGAVDKEALFAVVGYTPHAGQREVHASKASRRLLACGVRWGKTTLAVHEALVALLRPSTTATRGWVVTPTAPTTALIIDPLIALVR